MGPQLALCGLQGPGAQMGLSHLDLLNLLHLNSSQSVVDSGWFGMKTINNIHVIVFGRLTFCIYVSSNFIIRVHDRLWAFSCERQMVPSLLQLVRRGCGHLDAESWSCEILQSPLPCEDLLCY